MSHQNNDFNKYALYHEISDFYDLSIAEIVILEFLSRYSKPIVRHTLYTELNQFIRYKEEDPYLESREKNEDFEKKFFTLIDSEKNISTSSFYNSLSSLEKKGLVRFNKNKSNRIKSIEATRFTKFVPQLLLKFLINNTMSTGNDWTTFFIKFLEKIEKSRFERVLSVWFSENIVYSLIQQFSSYADEISILSTHVDLNEQNNLKKTNLENLLITSIRNGVIKESNDYFDIVLVPVYKQNPKFFKMERNVILNELVRVCKLNGLVIIVALSDMQLTNNPFTDELISMYKSLVQNRLFTKDELREDMEKAGMSGIQIEEFRGYLIGVGRKI